MEFIGGFLVAVFIYVYGSYCGNPELDGLPVSGELRTLSGHSRRIPE
jgi:hypothetical protein